MQPRKFSFPTNPFFAALVACLLLMTLMTQSVQAKTKFKVLHTFRGAPNDGEGPDGMLVRDSAGNFYGTTVEGGTGRGQCSSYGGCGTAFKMSSTGKLIWLHSFKYPNGFDPMAGVLRDKAGYLYGTTTFGGKNSRNCPIGCGVVFMLDPTGEKETVLHRFKGGSDGNNPEALLTQDSSGNFYGTTISGGDNQNNGVAFKVNSAGQESLFYTLTGGADGGSDYPGVIWRPGGDLFGVANGGTDNAGIVFELDAAGNETVLYSFLGGQDGGGPDSVLVADATGNLYGSTKGGGNDACGGSGCGTVFKLTAGSDGSWTEQVLYVFCSLSNCADGEYPGAGPLVLDMAGNLYGTTYLGGAYPNCNGDSCGVVFKLDTTGKETVLHSFTGGADGAFPYSGLVLDNGNLYGTAEEGGDTSCHAPHGCGVVFTITP
jgi:uncharacterized repeat protein (TIGR03803 family)